MPAEGRRITYSKKVCMLGSFGVGKTSLVRRFVHGLFDDRYLSTIGVQVYQKELSDLPFPAGRKESVNLILWDLANIEKFTATIRNYFLGAAAAVVVFDLTRSSTFDEKALFLDSFLDINPRAKLVLVGNKTDLFAQPMSPPKELTALSQKLSAPTFLTSAREGTNVAEMFVALGRRLLER